MSGLSISLITLLVVVGILLYLLKTMYRKVETGNLLVIYGMKNNRVSLKNTFTIPYFDKVHYISSNPKDITIENNYGKDGDGYVRLSGGDFYTKDNIKVQVKVVFFVGIPSDNRVFDLLSRFGVDFVQSHRDLSNFFNAKFSESVKNAVRSVDLEDLLSKRKEFSEKVSSDLTDSQMSGFILTDVSLEEISPLSLEYYDDNNHIEISGKRLMIERSEDNKVQIQQKIEVSKTMIERNRKAEEEQRSALDSMTAINIAIAENDKKVRTIEEELRTEQARIASDLKVELANVDKEKEIELKQEAIRRDLEAQRISHQQQLDVQSENSRKIVESEREDTNLEVMKRRKNIEKVEVSENAEIKKKQAEVVKTEHGIQIEVEGIENLKVQSEAERHKLDSIKRAEARAESMKIEQTNESNIAVAVSENEIAIKRNSAEADFIKVEKEAEGKKLLASAIKEETAAIGLAEAEVIRQRGLAQAEADTAVYEAKKGLPVEVREHEISLIEIENRFNAEVERIKANREIAIANASVLSAAMSQSKINIVGGGDTFSKLQGLLTAGQAVDVLGESSDVGGALIEDYKNGKRHIVDDIKEVLKSEGSNASNIKDLVIAGNIGKITKIVDALGGKDQVLKVLENIEK